MKNMKIGAKIMTGFGIVIAMMLIIAAVVVTSNVGSINNVNMTDANATLQHLTSSLEINYLNSRVPANLMSGTMDPATYAEFTKFADAIDQNFEEVYAFISENPLLEKFRPTVQAAQESFGKWRSNVDAVGSLNAEQSEYYDQLSAGGQALVDATSGLLDEQLDTIVTEINTNAGDEALLWRAARISRANAITQDIASARVIARQITGTYDATMLPDALSLFDNVLANAAVHRDESRREVQREAAQVAIDAVTAYRNALENFGETCLQSAAAKAEMASLNSVTQAAFVEVTDSINAAMDVRISDTLTAATSSLVIVIVVLILAVLASVTMAVIIMRGITVPIAKMHGVIDIVGNTGRMEFSDAERAEVESGISKDEIGQSIESFVKMIDRLGIISSTLKKVAAGDLTVTLKPLTDEDTMGIAVSSMVDNLNNMFSDITSSTVQVSSGASQIADGAQMLAQGATEQSATVEQLSASVSQVSAQTKRNATVAEEARSLESTIKKNAEQGAEQMGQMMQAVKEISEASQSIGKVIKIIDDIAFQTNILALNAAVEAARAGQHGKGFAVVADEVRNLAAKSAAAAKDTGELIESSIKKSEMGASISQETSKSLNLIVEGILQSSQLIAEIAKSSGEQSIAINQISEAIDQVSQVVQQNSATSEESAAASEEMSGQAALLQQLIAQFRLKNSGGATPLSVASGASGASSTGFSLGN